MLGSVMLVLLMALVAVLPTASVAAPKLERAVLYGVIENCWNDGTDWTWHTHGNNIVATMKGMQERWVSVFGNESNVQIFTSLSTLRSAQGHIRSDGTIQYHNSYAWAMYPGYDTKSATGWYEFNGVADTVDSIPFHAAGWLVSHATGIGRGTLQGQNAHFTMVWVSEGPSSSSSSSPAAEKMCVNHETVNWNGTMRLEINNVP
jgi:hypothetical protein